MNYASGLLLIVASTLSAPPPKPRAAPASRPRGSDAELAKRLLDDPDAANDPLARMTSLMGDAGRRLSEKYDSGKQTQDVQTRALQAMDEAIIDARNNLAQSRSSTSVRQKGETRTAGRRNGASDASKPGQGEPTQKASESGQGPGGGSSKTKPLAERPELRRGWGYLPERDREAILQGAHESFHDKYRDYIEQYYTTLARRAEKPQP